MNDSEWRTKAFLLPLVLPTRLKNPNCSEKWVGTPSEINIPKERQNISGYCTVLRKHSNMNKVAAGLGDHTQILLLVWPAGQEAVF